MPGLKKIAVLTSGGDAPGMNAAVRAVTRGALARGWECSACVTATRVSWRTPSGRSPPATWAGSSSPAARCSAARAAPSSPRRGTREGARQPALARRGRAGGDRRQRLAVGLREPRARRLPGGRRAFHHRQRSLRQRRQHRLRHGDQHHAGGDRPPAHHRVVAPARLRRGDDGPQLRLHRADVGHRRRRRGDRDCQRASSSPRTLPSGCAPRTSAARPMRSPSSPRARNAACTS